MAYVSSAPVMDDFVRDNTVGGLGRGAGIEWAEQVGNLGDTAVVKGRAAAVLVSANGSSAMVKSLTLNNDVEVAATVLNPSTSVNSDFSLFLCVEGATNAARTGYELRLDGFGPYKMAIYKYTAGTAAQLATANMTFDPASGDRLVFVRRGIGLYGYLVRGPRGAEQIVTTTDAAYTSGSVGLGVAGVARLTDFRFGDATPDPLAPTTSLLDTFVRADETPIGGNWVSPAYTPNPTDYLYLVSNTLRARGNSFQRCCSIWDRDVFGYNQEAWATIGNVNLVNGLTVGFAMRVNGTGASRRWQSNRFSLTTPGNTMTSGTGFGGSEVFSTNSTFRTNNSPTPVVAPAVGDQFCCRMLGTTAYMLWRPILEGEWKILWTDRTTTRDYEESANGGYNRFFPDGLNYKIGMTMEMPSAAIPSVDIGISQFGGGTIPDKGVQLHYPALG